MTHGAPGGSGCRDPAFDDRLGDAPASSASSVDVTERTSLGV
jgi:hypothetical protein